ncbi:MAG: hypothetical protein ACR2IN_07330, partial [Thermoleophilaceae bacterium]
IVPDDQLSLAIGKEGQNARLAARLTGWRVDIRSETEFAEDDSQGYEEEEVAGRCFAIMSTGKRCPNAALPSSRYCGLPTHQALAEQEGEQVVAADAQPEPSEPAGPEPAAGDPEPAAGDPEPAAGDPEPADPEPAHLEPAHPAAGAGEGEAPAGAVEDAPAGADNAAAPDDAAEPSTPERT